jgi:hypothetical protein
MKPDVLVELKSLRLHGMAGAWVDMVEQGGNAGIETSRWLIEHLLQAEATDRAIGSTIIVTTSSEPSIRPTAKRPSASATTVEI